MDVCVHAGENGHICKWEYRGNGDTLKRCANDKGEICPAEHNALKAEIERLRIVSLHHAEQHVHSQGTAEMWEGSSRSNERKRKAAEAHLREVACSGVEHDDPRNGYACVQIDRATWCEIVARYNSP